MARVTYRLERVRCGNPACKCRGEGHGPYWYAYFRQDGKLRKRYIGKELPAELRGEAVEDAVEGTISGDYAALDALMGSFGFVRRGGKAQ